MLDFFKKFDLLEPIINVVKSVKELKTNNQFIKVLLMLKFNINQEKAFSYLQNSYFPDNKEDGDHTNAFHCLKKNDHNLINKGYELMISAASKSQPHAIIYLIDIIIDIVDGKITIYDEKNQINEIIKSIYDLNILQNNQQVSSEQKFIRTNNNTISVTNIINIFSILEKYIPVFEFQYEIALLHGIGINKLLLKHNQCLIIIKKVNIVEIHKKLNFINLIANV